MRNLIDPEIGKLILLLRAAGLCLIGPILVLSALQRCQAASYGGREYVSLNKWAHDNHLEISRLPDGRKVVLTNQTTRIVFFVDSAQAEINGIQVRLSFPCAVDKAAPSITQFDLDTAIDPLLFPVRVATTRPIKTICLDPGHGGRDTGNRAGGQMEKSYTLLLAWELRNQLQKAGFKVILTRTADRYVALPDRPALANRLGADLFVSLHFNATSAGVNEVEGPETYCITPVGADSSNEHTEGDESGSANWGATTGNRNEKQSLRLAYQVQKALVQYLPASDRGVKRARFAVLRDAEMPAILIEGGFMTHPVESKKIYSVAYRHRMAEAIVKGILAYK